MSETKQTRKFCRSVESIGGMTYPLVASEYAPPGWPDRYMVLTPFMAFVEFKSVFGRYRPEQKEVFPRLLQRGVPLWTFRFSEDETLILVEHFDVGPITGWLRWSEVIAWMQTGGQNDQAARISETEGRT